MCVYVCVCVCVQELIEYYKHHSLREGFRSLDTTLQFPYRDPENTATLRTNRPGGSSMFTPSPPPLLSSFLSSSVLFYSLVLSPPLCSSPFLFSSLPSYSVIV